MILLDDDVQFKIEKAAAARVEVVVRKFVAAAQVAAVHTAPVAVVAFHTKAAVASAPPVVAYRMLVAVADRMLVEVADRMLVAVAARMLADAAFLHNLAFEVVQVVDP